MKVPPKRTILPTGKRIASQRLRTTAERADAKRGATEQDVQPLTPPSAETGTPRPNSADSQIDPADELTPG